MYKNPFTFHWQIPYKYSISFSCKTNIFLLIENHVHFIQFPKPISHIFFIKNQIHVLYLSCIKYIYKIHCYVKYLYEKSHTNVSWRYKTLVLPTCTLHTTQYPLSVIISHVVSYPYAHYILNITYIIIIHLITRFITLMHILLSISLIVNLVDMPHSYPFTYLHICSRVHIITYRIHTTYNIHVILYSCMFHNKHAYPFIFTPHALPFHYSFL